MLSNLRLRAFDYATKKWRWVNAPSEDGGSQPPVVFTGTDPDERVLTVEGANDQSVSVLVVQMGTDVADNFPGAIDVKDSNNQSRFYTDGYGNTQVVLDGDNDSSFIVQNGVIGAVFTAKANGAVGELGFYEAPSVPQPVVPMTTPDVQDVIDALVALGLVTQSD